MNENVALLIETVGNSSNIKILRYLSKNGESTFSELKKNLSINPATLSKRLKQLTAMEMIAGDRSHDYIHVYYGIHKHNKSIKRLLDAIERLATEY